MDAGGGGPKAKLLQKMISEEGLESRVHMVGPVPHEKARDLLVSDWHDSQGQLSMPAVLTMCSECILGHSQENVRWHIAQSRLRTYHP